MDLSKKLKEKGWHLTEEGLKKLKAETKTEDVQKIVAVALNTDFREIAGGALPVKREESTLRGRIVLQVQKVRNIAAPKSNEESKVAPRFLQLDLTDGQTNVQALELEPVTSLNLNVAPGTKINFLADTLQLMHGFIILRPSELELLGGRVDALYEKWDMARTLQKYTRSGRRFMGNNGTAPPPWVAFGKKAGDSKDTTANERSFKSLAALQDKEKESKENAEFNAMRSQAIASAIKEGTKKIFGGGGQTIVDHNIKKILDKGYSEEDAKHALRTTNNNLERALYNLKRRSEKKDSYETMQPERGRHTGGKRFGGGARDTKDEGEASKPAGNVSLFDFLTNKLPATDTPAPTAAAASASNKQTTNTTNQRANRFEKSEVTANERSKFENNISSSFAANRSSGPRDGGHSYRGRGVGGGGSERPTRSGNKEPYTRSDGNESNKDPRRNPNPRKPVRDGRESNAREEKRKEDARDGGRRPDPPRNEKSRNNFEQRRGNERQRETGNYSQRSETAGNDNPRSTRAVASHTSSNTTNRNNEEYAKQVDKLIESTGNLKIDKSNDARGGARKPKSYGGGQYQQPNQKSQSQIQQPHSTTTTTIQQQTTTNNTNNNINAFNGYNYDPSKIIGFQSKETNEFALSLLKSQGLAVPHASSAPAPTQSHHQPQQPPTPQPSTVTNAPSANFMPSPTPYTQSNYMLPNTQAALLQSAQQYGMGNNDGWLWKIGDLCLAKYWDDGRYYEAEITAISENTCVVFFLGYGNHEEVLKTDCLPVTDSNHRVINNRQPISSMQNAGGSVYHQPRGNVGSGGGLGGHRCRGERQMYVPPHKR